MNQPGSKSFDISKRVVVAAFEKVRDKKGAPGIDGVTVEQFAQDRKNNLYKLWNRMSSGSYFPSPVRMVEIPKDGGRGVRVLGVPSVVDRIAQTVAVAYLEPLVEPVFHCDSYGYRPGRSPLDVVATCRARCFTHGWVLDLDIEGFFDNLDHDLILKAVAHHTTEKWFLMYVQRWLSAPLAQPDGTLTRRDRGSPQGASISPLLANLFMHYAFDTWMAREFPDVPFERFVDDVIVHCVSQQQAVRLREAIAARLAECGGLRLHPTKTRIVYCKMSGRYGSHEQVTFDFLGFRFKPRAAKRKHGKMFTTFSPAISRKAARSIRQQIRRMRFHLRQRPVLRRHHQNDQLEGWCLGGVLRAVLPVGNHQGAVPHRPVPGAVGPPQVQTPPASTPTSRQDPGRHQACSARPPRALAMGDLATSGCSTSRMTGAR